MIFPDWGTAPETASEAALPLFQEWAVDWDGKSFALRGGEPYLVSGDEALKIWVTRALRPESERFRYTAWSADYGNELASLLGGCVDQGILESQVRQYVREALLASPYIREVDGFSFVKTGSRVEARFTVHTVYEEFTQKTEVSISSSMAARSTKNSASPSAVRSVSSAGSSTMVTVSSVAATMVQSENASTSARRRAVIFFIGASFLSDRWFFEMPHRNAVYMPIIP